MTTTSRVGSVGQCASALGCVYLPSEVRTAKNQLQSVFVSVNRDAHLCAASGRISQEILRAWLGDRTAWDDFFAASDGFFTANREMRQAQEFERRLATWQAVFARAGCALAAPPVTPVPANEPTAIGTAASAVRTVAIAAAVIVGGIVLLEVLPRRR